MSNSEESRRIVTRMYEFVSSGDFAAFVDMMDDKITICEPSYLPFGGVTIGKEALQRLFATISTYLNVLSIRVESMVADADVVVVFFKAKTNDSGEEVDICERSVVKNGKVTEMRIYYHEGQTLFPRAPRKPS